MNYQQLAQTLPNEIAQLREILNIVESRLIHLTQEPHWKNEFLLQDAISHLAERADSVSRRTNRAEYSL